jgi:methionyl-tRNA formyltransferase
VMVVSQPDRRRGRGSALVPSPVKAAALDLGLEVTDVVDDVLGLGADLAVVVAFGQLIKPHVLDVLPMVNLHFSLLPRWRGAAPVERAILAGDPVTGVCLMELVEELDAGRVYAIEEVAINDDLSLEDLRGKLVDVGTTLLVDTLAQGLGQPIEQDGEVVYAKKIQPGELQLDLERSARELHRVIRLGGAWVELRGKRLRIWQAEVVEDGPRPGHLIDGVVGTGSGGLRLIEVQPEGKQRMSASAWLNGAQLTPNDRFG